MRPPFPMYKFIMYILSVLIYVIPSKNEHHTVYLLLSLPFLAHTIIINISQSVSQYDDHDDRLCISHFYSNALYVSYLMIYSLHSTTVTLGILFTEFM